MFETLSNAKLHLSWLELMPRKNNEDSGINEERIEEYLQRIGHSFKNIPKEVLQQWLYLHTQNSDMIKNYGWIDYHKITFTQVFWTRAEISQIQVFSKFQPYVEMRSETESFSDFTCIKEDKDYWLRFGTWRTPIVVLNTRTITNSPNYSELNKPYQLIEGHSRLGYFRAFYKYHEKDLNVAKQHRIFLMEVN